MESPTSTFSWHSAILGAVGTAIASLGTVLLYLINRKKLPSEVHKTDAEASLAEAQADGLRLKTGKEMIEAFSELIADIGNLEYDKLQLRRKCQQQEERIKILETEIQRFKAERTLQRLGPTDQP